MEKEMHKNSTERMQVRYSDAFEPKVVYISG